MLCQYCNAGLAQQVSDIQYLRHCTTWNLEHGIMEFQRGKKVHGGSLGNKEILLTEKEEHRSK